MIYVTEGDSVYLGAQITPVDDNSLTVYFFSMTYLNCTIRWYQSALNNLSHICRTMYRTW